MKRALIIILKVAGGIIGFFLIAVLVIIWLLNTPSIQNKILRRASQLLTEKLETKVEIDSIHIGFFRDDIALYGLEIEDREHRKMLQMECLAAEIDMMALLQHEVKINEVVVKGLKAQLYKPSPETPANYQFVIDAFKSDKPKKEKTKLSVNLSKANIEQVEVTYNDNHFSLREAHYNKGWIGGQTARIEHLQASWVHIKKKDSTHVDNQMVIDAVNYEEKGNQRFVNIDSLRYKTDNHLPHKRTGKPKRGWFDDGHLNVVANMKIAVNHADKDSICGELTHCEANDIASGFHITQILCLFKYQDGKIHVSDATVAMKNTTLQFKSGDIQLPSKKKGIPFQFYTSDIKGTTLLTDISHPFAPVLKEFKQPLELSTKMSGTDSNLVFKDVVVNTPDKKLLIYAAGGIEGLKDKYKLNVHFNVSKMTTNPATVERIINQFPVKKFMMKQLRTLGYIHYTGSFNVLWKKEQFRGTISTRQGNMNFFFALDEKNKYLSGNVQTKAFELGKAMDYPDIGTISCRAGFRFDISKPRTAQMRRVKGGKLPIGKVDALVYKAKYKFVSASNIAAHIVSDGAVAEGKINMKGKLADVLCSFSFTNTDDMKKTKIKPGVKLHLFGKKSDEEKAQRKAEKEKKKQQNAEEKAQKKQQKAEERAVKKQQKAELKEARRQEKAAKKAAKEAAKENQK